MARSEEDRYYSVALKLVKQAGSLVRDAFEKPNQQVLTKASEVDLVTETDGAVEKMLFSGLANQFPDHKFIGEESSSEMGKMTYSDDPTWIIDPIDGTTNFVHRCPHIAICVGLTIKKEIHIGIVYNPILDQLFTARLGQGAFKNGFPITCSNTTVLSKAVLCGSLGIHNIVHKPGVLEVYLDNLRQMVHHGIRGQRSFGSAALNMVYIAEGCVDAYVEYGIHCWDIAAATLIIREAGGCVIDPNGNELDLMKRRVLCASTPELAHSLGAIMKHVDYDREATDI